MKSETKIQLKESPSTQQKQLFSKVAMIQKPEKCHGHMLFPPDVFVGGRWVDGSNPRKDWIAGENKARGINVIEYINESPWRRFIFCSDTELTKGD